MRKLESSDLLVSKIDGKIYGYIKPEVGDFNTSRTFSDHSVVAPENHHGRIMFSSGSTYGENLYAERTKIGLKLSHNADAFVYNYVFMNTESETKFASAIHRSGSHRGDAQFLRVYGDGKDKPGKPSATGGDNTDFFDNDNSTDADRGAIFFRDVTSKNFTDSGFDAKSDVYIMNATITDSYRGFKIWYDSDVYIVNSTIDTAAANMLVTLMGPNAKLYYYNTTWNGKDEVPLNKIQVVGVDNHRNKTMVAQKNVIELDKNPLPKFDEFFQVDDSQYVAQVSFNGGAWKDVKLPSGGELGSHVGDTLFELPNFGAGSYKLRAWTETGGLKSAVVSQTYVIDKKGIKAQATDTATTPEIVADLDDLPKTEDTSDFIVFLVDTETNRVLETVTDGERIAASVVARRDIGVVVEIDPSSALADDVGSVSLDFENGRFTRTESIEPYALFGDNGRGDFLEGRALSKGAYTLELDAFAKSGGRGAVLASLELDFSIV